MSLNMKKLIILASAVAGIFMASSCGKMLEVTPPNNIYDEQIEALADVVAMFRATQYSDFFEVADMLDTAVEALTDYQNSY